MGYQGPQTDYDPAARAAEQASLQNFQYEVESKAVSIPIYFRKKKIYNLRLFTERELASAEAGAPQRGLNIRDLLRDHVARWLSDPAKFAEIERVDIIIDDDFINVEYRNRDPIQDSKLITQLFRPDRFAGGSITRVVNLAEPKQESKPQLPHVVAGSDGRVQPYSPQATEFDPTPAPEDKKKSLADGLREEQQHIGPVQKAAT